MKIKLTRGIALLLVVAVLFSVLPLASFAEDDGTSKQPIIEESEQSPETEPASEETQPEPAQPDPTETEAAPEPAPEEEPEQPAETDPVEETEAPQVETEAEQPEETEAAEDETAPAEDPAPEAEDSANAEEAESEEIPAESEPSSDEAQAEQPASTNKAKADQPNEATARMRIEAKIYFPEYVIPEVGARVSKTSIFHIDADGKSYNAYCLDPEKSTGQNAGYNPAGTGSSWSNLSRDKQRALSLILAYASGVAKQHNRSLTIYDRFVVEIMVWEIVAGQRNASNFTVTGNSGAKTTAIYDNIVLKAQGMDIVDANGNYVMAPWSESKMNDAKALYAEVIARIQKHGKIPTFAAIWPSSAPTYKLRYDSGRGVYTVTTPADTNDVLSDFTWSAPGMTFIKNSDNTMTVETADPNAIPSDALSAIGQGFDAEANENNCLAWEPAGENTGRQGCVAFNAATPDPAPAYIKLARAGAELRISTTAMNADTNGKYILPVEDMPLLDRVSITNEGDEEDVYLKAQLMEARLEDGNWVASPFKVDGNPVVIRKDFRVAAGESTVDMNYVLNARNLDGKRLVWYETVYRASDDVELASHRDAGDEGQTVFVVSPKIKTYASNNEDGSKMFYPLESVTLKDAAQATEIVADYDYRFVGKIYLTENGEEIQASVTEDFSADSAEKVLDMLYTFKATELRGKSVTVGLDLYWINGSGAAILLASHKDMNDADQTVKFRDPTAHTTATEAESNSHYAYAVSEVTIPDAYHYYDHEPGKPITVVGTVMLKRYDKDGNPYAVELLRDGKPVTQTITIDPKDEEGVEYLWFTFNALELEGEKVVIFEREYYNGDLLVVHEDVNDEEQTVTFRKPVLHTTATVNGSHYVDVAKKTKLDDVVDHENLYPGSDKPHVFVGQVMVPEKVNGKWVGKPFLVNGKPVISTVEIYVKEPNGKVVVSFEFDSTALKGKSCYIAETVYYDGKIIAVHNNPLDKGQTVHFNTTTETGDDNSPALWFALFIGSAALFLSMCVWSKRRRIWTKL